MPRSTYQFQRCSSQYSCHCSSVPGSTKNSISICSNSRVRKMKLPGVISLRKLLPVWAMPNGGLLARRVQHVEEVDEDALRGLRPQVVQRGLVLDRAEVGAQHAAELLRLGPLSAGAAVGAGDLGQAVLRRSALARLELLLELVGAEAVVAVLALGQRVGERGDVAGGLPHLRREDHRGVDADDVVAALHHRLPPLAPDVLLQLDAERAVVPRRTGAAVDLARREDEPAPFAQVDDGVVAGGGWVGGHCDSCDCAGGSVDEDFSVSGTARAARRCSIRLASTWISQAASAPAMQSAT